MYSCINTINVKETYTYTHIHTHTHIYIYTYICICMCVYIYNIYIYMIVSNERIHSPQIIIMKKVLRKNSYILMEYCLKSYQ